MSKQNHWNAQTVNNDDNIIIIIEINVNVYINNISIINFDNININIYIDNINIDIININNINIDNIYINIDNIYINIDLHFSAEKSENCEKSQSNEGWSRGDENDCDWTETTILFQENKIKN